MLTLNNIFFKNRKQENNSEVEVQLKSLEKQKSNFDKLKNLFVAIHNI